MASVRPFRFGVQATKATSAAEWRDLVRRIEGLGYSTVFLADHYLGRGLATKRASQVPQHLAPIAAMATAAAVTETLRVGCRVFCIDYHEPAVLAKEAATLDLLSDGRLEFGIGAGWSEHEYAAMGIPFAPAPLRIDKLEEVLALVNAHWSGTELAFAGEHVNVSGYTGLPLPVQRPRPSIMIGGAKPRVLKLAAREADIVSFATLPRVVVDEHGRTPMEEAVRRVGIVREAAGTRFSQLDLESSPVFTAVTDEPEAIAAKIATAMGMPVEALREHPNALFGSVDEVVDRLQGHREVMGINYVTIQQTELEAFAPIVSRLAGT